MPSGWCRDLLNFLILEENLCEKNDEPLKLWKISPIWPNLFQMGQRSVSILPESNIPPETRSFQLDCLTIGHPKRKFYPSNHRFSLPMLTSCGRKLIFLRFPSPAWQGWSNPVNSALTTHKNTTCIFNEHEQSHFEIKSAGCSGIIIWIYDTISEFLQYLIRIDFWF